MTTNIRKPSPLESELFKPFCDLPISYFGNKGSILVEREIIFTPEEPQSTDPKIEFRFYKKKEGFIHNETAFILIDQDGYKPGTVQMLISLIKCGEADKFKAEASNEKLRYLIALGSFVEHPEKGVRVLAYDLQERKLIDLHPMTHWASPFDPTTVAYVIWK